MRLWQCEKPEQPRDLLRADAAGWGGQVIENQIAGAREQVVRRGFYLEDDVRPRPREAPRPVGQQVLQEQARGLQAQRSAEAARRDRRLDALQAFNERRHKLIERPPRRGEPHPVFSRSQQQRAAQSSSASSRRTCW